MLKDAFSNSMETDDFHHLDALRNHYYQNNYDDVRGAIVKMCEELNYKIMNIDDNFKEILVEYNHGEIIFTSILYGYTIQLSMKINSNYFIPFKRPIRDIKNIYAYLDKKLNLKKVGGKDE